MAAENRQLHPEAECCLWPVGACEQDIRNLRPPSPSQCLATMTPSASCSRLCGSGAPQRPRPRPLATCCAPSSVRPLPGAAPSSLAPACGPTACGPCVRFCIHPAILPRPVKSALPGVSLHLPAPRRSRAVSVDVTRAFDHVSIPLLLSLVEPLLGHEQYTVLKYSEVCWECCAEVQRGVLGGRRAASAAPAGRSRRSSTPVPAWPEGG